MTFQQLDKKHVKLADAICASAADDMDIPEIEYLISGLIKVRDLQAAKDSAKSKRLERMHAAQSDPKFRPIISRVDGELQRLGFEGVNAFAAEDGSLKKLDAAMTAANMDVEKRMSLKTNLHALGLI